MPTIASEVFPALRDILKANAGSCVITHDTPENFSLNVKDLLWKKKPVFFGAVQKKKNYVTLHLMPVYMNPKLQAEISPALKKRMQGKACFNFTQVDESLFAEMAQLVSTAAAVFPEYLKRLALSGKYA